MSVFRQLMMRKKENIEYMPLTVVGNPTINNGVVSNFSSDNYLKFMFYPRINGNPNIFEFKMKFQYYSASTIGCVLGTKMSGIIAIGVTTKNRIQFNLGKSINDFGIVDTVYSANVETYKDYWLKFSYDGNQYKLELSDDNISFATLGTIISSSLIYNGNYFEMSMGTGHPANWTLNGQIDINNCYLIQNGTKYKFLLPQ